MTKLLNNKFGNVSTAAQIEEIFNDLSSVKNTEGCWTKTPLDLLDLVDRAEEQLENAKLEESMRVGATAVCYLDEPSNSSGDSDTHNEIHLYRIENFWQVVAIKKVCYISDNSNTVKVFLEQKHIYYIRNKSVENFGVRSSYGTQLAKS